MIKYFQIIKCQMRKKSNFITAIIIGLAIGIIILVNTYQKSWHNYLKSDIYNGLIFRNLQVSSEDDNDTELKALQNINHITNITPMYEYRELLEIEDLTTNKEKFARANIFTANNESLPKIVKGTSFPDDDNYYMVCPQNFYPVLASEEELRNKSSNDSTDLTSYIGDNLTLKYYGNLYNIYESEDYIFRTPVKLVGLYKNNDFEIDENTCFVNHKTMSDIVLNKYKDDMNSYELQKNNSFIITVDNAENMTYVTKNLDDLGYNYRLISYIDTDYINEVNGNINLAIIIIFVLIFIFVFIMFQKDFREDKKQYELLHKIGYARKKIRLIYMFSTILKILIYLISIVIISFILCTILKIMLNYYPYLFAKFRVLYDFKGLNIAISILILNLILNTIFNFKKMRLE